MKTYTFYSYKGGTGRSLLLANCAHYLALLGHRVVALDFDLEAPGLHFKFNVDPSGASPGDFVPGAGVVDYLLHAAGDRPPGAIVDYFVSVPLPKSVRGTIHLMPAGAAPTGDYWRALTHLLRQDFFIDPEGVGIAACLELKARIEEELGADFLLIDSRTGVTELAGVTTTVLADKVVCLMLANRESQAGARAVLRSLGRAPRLPGQPPVEVIPVLSRIPELDQTMAKNVLDFLNEPGPTPEDTLALERVFLLRSDPDLGRSEAIRLISEVAEAWSPLHHDYILLLTALVASGAREPSTATRQFLAIRSAQDRLLSDESMTTRDKLKVVLRGLEKHEKRQEKHLRRHVAYDERSRAPRAEDVVELASTRLYLKSVVRLLFSLIPTALEAQVDRDHDLLISIYRLDTVGVRRRLPPDALTFPSENARTKAGYRARARFRQTLEDLVAFEREAAPEHRKRLYSDVLRLVRAESGLQDAVFLALEEVADRGTD